MFVINIEKERMVGHKMHGPAMMTPRDLAPLCGRLFAITALFINLKESIVDNLRQIQPMRGCGSREIGFLRIAYL